MNAAKLRSTQVKALNAAAEPLPDRDDVDADEERSL
jgi:hypothetical protein